MSSSRTSPARRRPVLARSIAGSIEGASTARIQCTPTSSRPTSPAVGLRPAHARLRVPPGPIFANVVLVDEVNARTPKTQSALLEAMAERQVTVDGLTRELPDPPPARDGEPDRVRGHVPAPEAQLDRFFLEDGAFGYPEVDDELTIIDEQRLAHPLGSLQPAVTLDDIAVPAPP